MPESPNDCWEQFFSRLSELLVGAPFYSDDLHPEQGKVYLYENKGNGSLVLSLNLTVQKDKWRANFGRALASVGDLDLDGYQGTMIAGLLMSSVTIEVTFVLQICLELLHNGGGTVHSTPVWVVWVRDLAGNIVLCSWARHVTLAVSLSTQVYKFGGTSEFNAGVNRAVD